MTLVQNIQDFMLAGVPEKYMKPKLEIVPGYGNVLVAKYSKRTFYDQAWKQYPILKQARGAIFEAKSGQIITRPFDKVFNFGEEGAGMNLYDGKLLSVTRKINGFFGAITYVGNGVSIYQSSGSTLDSNDFVRMLKEKAKYINPDWGLRGMTYMFEVVHENDPHIIEEEPGLYMIGVRNVKDGYLWSEEVVDTFPIVTPGVRRIKSEEMEYQDLKKLMPTLRTEGMMVRDPYTREVICKWKSPYYLSRKLMARASDKTLDKILLDTGSEQFDEEVNTCVGILADKGISIEMFKMMTEEQRLEAIR